MVLGFVSVESNARCVARVGFSACGMGRRWRGECWREVVQEVFAARIRQPFMSAVRPFAPCCDVGSLPKLRV